MKTMYWKKIPERFVLFQNRFVSIILYPADDFKKELSFKTQFPFHNTKKRIIEILRVLSNASICWSNSVSPSQHLDIFDTTKKN